MKFSIKNKFILFGLLAAINIAIRLPTTEHALGVDTFYIFSLAESISTFGFARWIIHPASFIGAYPYSYPSAYIFILSGLSQTTGISADYIILLIGILLGISGIFFMFLLAKEVWDNDLYAFFAAFAFSLSFIVLKFTYWQASTRSLFMGIFPLFLWILLKYHKSIKILFSLGLIFFILLAASHRVSFLLPVVIIAFCVVILLEWLSNKVKIGSFVNPAILQVHIFYILAIISSILFTIQFLNVGPFDVKDYYTGFFFTGDDFFSSFSNMAVDYTSKIGLIFFFMVPGFIILTGKSKKKNSELFVILCVIAFLPLLGYENYSAVFIAPFFILISTFGFMGLYNFFIKKKILANIAIIALMVLSLLFIFFMFNHSHMFEASMQEKTFNSAQFIKLKSNGTIISNNGDLASKLTSYSTKPSIPLGGSYVIYQPPGQIIYGFINKEDLGIRPMTLNELNPKVDEFWVASNSTNAKDEWVTIMENNYWDEKAKNMLSKYNANLIIELGETGQYLYWKNRFSRMLVSLHDSGNKIYSNGQENIYPVDSN